MRVGLIGYGYWGQKIARVLKEIGVLTVIADRDSNRSNKALMEQDVPSYSSLEAILVYKDPVDAVAIATPSETHYEIAKAALEAGKHVFVEKPLTTNYEEACKLEKLALEKGLTLKVGHIYLHNPGLMAIPRPIGEAELWVKLLNIAGPPSDSTRDILWAGLPHAVSIALHFFGDYPDDITIMKKDEHRIRVHLAWDDHSRAYLDVGDYTERRMRDVELRVGNTRYYFNADNPHWSWQCSGANPSLSAGKPSDFDPLTLELKDFIENKGVDTMGSKVVKLIEEVRGAITETNK